MFLLCPGSHFFYRQSVVVQHDLILQCAGAERAIVLDLFYNASSQFAMENRVVAKLV